MKILAIDDNRDNLITLQAVLRDSLPGSETLTAQSGQQGLDLARAENPDVILLDIVMPGMDGFAVCRQLKADDRLCEIPVIFLTALRTDRESRVRAVEAGAEGFLSKPFDEVELTTQVQAMAKIKTANRMQRLEKEQLSALVAERTRELREELAERRRVEEVLREAENALRESEERVQRKLQSILAPQGDLGSLELADIIDVKAIRFLMEKFCALTGIPNAIIDLKGKVLVSAGWQDLCTKFHRCHPETLKNCIECDTILSKGVPPNTFKTYLCKNNLWDCVTPLLVGGQHVGNLFAGQFFFAGERPDDSVFRAQAAKYGFDEEAYMAALNRVSIKDRATITIAFDFYITLARMITSLSHNNISLARLLEERKRAEAKQREQMTELQRWHDVTLGREGRVLELKNEVNALLAKTGQPPRYGTPEDGNR